MCASHGDGYRVEVSGWDADRQFFVEKTNLIWDEASTNIVLLRQQLRRGFLVFVRVLKANETGKVYPTAYRVEAAGSPDHTGFCSVRLVPSQDHYEMAGNASSDFV